MRIEETIEVNLHNSSADVLQHIRRLGVASLLSHFQNIKETENSFFRIGGKNSGALVDSSFLACDGIEIRVEAIENVIGVPFVNAFDLILENVTWQFLDDRVRPPLHTEQLFGSAECEIVLNTPKAGFEY